MRQEQDYHDMALTGLGRRERIVGDNLSKNQGHENWQNHQVGCPRFHTKVQTVLKGGGPWVAAANERMARLAEWAVRGGENSGSGSVVDKSREGGGDSFRQRANEQMDGVENLTPHKKNQRRSR